MGCSSSNTKETIIKTKKKKTIKTNEKEKDEIIYNDEMKTFESMKLKFEKYKEDYNILYKKFFDITQNHDSFVIENSILLEKLNIDIEEINDSLKISIKDLTIPEDISKIINEQNSIYVKLRTNLETITNNFSYFKKIYESINNVIKTDKENIIDNIQNSINEIINNNNSNKLKNVLINSNKIIFSKLHELENIIKDIENDLNRNLYASKKEEIIKDINNIQNEINNYKNRNGNIKNIIIEELENDFKKINKNTIKNSMLIINKEDPNEIFSSQILFDNNNNEEKINKTGLIYQNWNEKCLIHNDYDIHEINFDLKAVGLPGRICLNNCSIGLNLDSEIEIIDLQLDGNKTKAEFRNSTIRFKINLGNEQINKVYLKYKEMPLFNELNDGEIEERKFYRYKFYGLKHYLQNQMAKFRLLNNSDFEIISFGDEFLEKSNENEYIWGGKVPPEGKRTMVRMSKHEGKFVFEIQEKIQNIDKNPIHNEILNVPFYFEEGNNTITKIDYLSTQSKQIEKKENKKIYEVKFINIKESIGIFSLKIEFTNKCKGEWKCEFNDNEIDEKIPIDFKQYKTLFLEKANNIIKEYNEEHKNDLIEVIDMVKIGKWVKNNIKYDSNYLKRYKITAIETLENKIGASHHITLLYNALMYSLGYKCIYVSGFSVNKTNIYNDNDSHSWSLIKLNNKWLPFDATCGIFTGKLPVSHVFLSYFMQKANKNGIDNVKIKEAQFHGKFLG